MSELRTLTRESDVNLGLSARANVAKVNGAKLFLKNTHFTLPRGTTPGAAKTLTHVIM